jgi:hypothetical protein
VESLKPGFKKMSLFLLSHELVDFLLNPTFSTAYKIRVLDNLRMTLPPGMPIPFPPTETGRFFAWQYFPESLLMPRRKEELVQKTLSQYIDTLLPQLVLAYRGFHNLMREDISAKLKEELKKEYPELTSDFSPELAALLKKQEPAVISIPKSFLGLKEIPEKFVNQRAYDASSLDRYFGYIQLVIGCAGALLVIPRSLSLPESNYLRYSSPALFILVMLRGLSLLYSKYHSAQAKAQQLLQEAERLTEEHNEDDEPEAGPGL